MTKMIINYHSDINGVRRMTINGKSSSVINNVKNEMEQVIPFIRKITKEVNEQPKKKQKRFYKKLQVAVITLIPMLGHMKMTHAQEIMSFPLVDSSNKSLDLLPPEIILLLKQLILAFGTISVALATLFLMVAGVHMMMNNKAKAVEWNTNIIKGFGQVLLAPIIILLLTTLVGLLFKNVPYLEAFF